MSKKEMNLYKRCKNIFKSHGVDMGGGGDSSGGGMSYDLVIKSEDVATYTLISGSVEDTKAKLLSNIPINIGLIISTVVEGKPIVYSYNGTTVQYYEDVIAVLFHEIAGSSTTLGISSDGTITKES